MIVVLLTVGAGVGAATRPTSACVPQQKTANTSGERSRRGIGSGKETEPPTVGMPAAHNGAFSLDSPTFTGDWGGVRTALTDHGITFGLSFQQQGMLLFHGGRDTEQGFRQAQSYDADLRFDFEKLGPWPGGYGYFKVRGTSREALGFNDGKVGGLSEPNRDESRNDEVFVNKWWIGQRFMDGRIDVRVGRLQTHKDLFDITAYARHEDLQFMNSWLRLNPTVPHARGGGLFLHVQPADWLYLRMAAIDGEFRGVHHRDSRTVIDGAGEFLGFWELGLMPRFPAANGALPGDYRVGLWYDGRPREVFFDPGDEAVPPRFQRDSMGFYVAANQLLFKENAEPTDKQGLGMFVRYGHANEEVSEIEHFWSVGAQYEGLIPTRDADVMGFGVAQGILSGHYRNQIDRRADRETVYEWYYRIAVTPWLAITPDFQYIQNPGAAGEFKDAMIAGVRVRVVF